MRIFVWKRGEFIFVLHGSLSYFISSPPSTNITVGKFAVKGRPPLTPIRRSTSALALLGVIHSCLPP